MPFKITTQFDLAALDNLQNPKLNRILTTALNKTAISLRTQTRRGIQQRIKLKANVINRGLKLIRASRKQFAGQTPQARLQINSQPVPLIHYQARSTKKRGVSVNIKGQRKYLPRAFIATLRSGHRGVFQRIGKRRLPIQELYSTRLTDVLKNSDVMPALAQQAQQRFKIELERAVKFTLQKQAR